MEPELSRKKLCDSIIEGHPYPLFIVDKDLKIREFNPAAEKLTGWQKGEVIGKSCFEILKSDICKKNSPFAEPSREVRTCVGQDTAIKTKSGQEVAVIDGKAGELTDRQTWYRCKDKAGQVTGAGLGLAIVKGIIESHGGKIWAKSVPGKGTNFFFTIPKTETGKTR